jgi:glycosyltransferase involved in cell wall biosynthesis
MSNKLPQNSVIIPVYNVKNYLDDCLRSIVKQTHDNLEIILVDDGSTDSSGKKCDDWAKRDARIKVIHKKNEGLNYARRDGFKISSGEFIMFVDSDDMIDADTIKIMLNVAKKDSASMVMGGYMAFVNNDDLTNKTPGFREYKNIESDLPTIVKTPEQIYEYFLVRHRIPDPKLVPISTISACMKLIHRSMVECIDWDAANYRRSEDVPMMRQVYQNIKCLAVINRPFYFYRQSPNSLSRGGRNDFTGPDGKWRGIFEFLHEQFNIDREYIKQQKYDLEKDLLWQEIFSYCWYLKDEIENHNFYSDPREAKFLDSILPDLINRAKKYDKDFSMRAKKIGVGDIYNTFINIAGTSGTMEFAKHYAHYTVEKLKSELAVLLQQIEDKDNKIKNQSREIKEIVNSKSFKLGRAMTSPIRAAKRVISKD